MPSHPHREPEPAARQAAVSLLAHARRVLAHLPDLARDYAYALRHTAAQVVRRIGPGRGGERTVLLLPGIYETAGFLGPLKQALSDAGNDVHAISALRLNLAEPDALVRVVADYLDAHGVDDVVCVAHSKGGLLAKALMIDPRTRDRVRGAVCLCTPFGGSGLGALFVPGLGVRELLPRSRAITTLAANTEANARIVSVYPTFDPHIPEGSRLDGAENVELAGFGHFQVLSDKRFLDATIDAVDRLRERPAPSSAVAGAPTLGT